MTRNYRYEKLMNHFKSLKSDTKRITLTYKDIEDIIGFKLYKSAYKHRPYWNPSKTHTITRAWIECGWKIEDIKLGESVVFIRDII